MSPTIAKTTPAMFKLKYKSLIDSCKEGDKIPRKTVIDPLPSSGMSKVLYSTF